MTELLFKEEVFKVVGAAMRVYNELGRGFLEAVYQEALEIECELVGIPFVAQAKLEISYRDRRLKKHYVADILAFDEVVIELKTSPEITDIDLAQLINYLKASGEEGRSIDLFRPSQRASLAADRRLISED